MNKRNLALLISKHPLLRKLTEDKTIPNSVVARLIVEELMEAQTDLLKSALAGIRRDFNEDKQEKYIDADTRKPVYPYGRLNKLDEEEQTKYKDAVNKKVQAFLAKQNPETKAQGEKIEKQVDAAIDKEIGAPQDTEQEDETFNSLDIPKYGNIIELALEEYKNIPIEELASDDAKLVVALTHRYFDNRALEEQISSKEIFLGALGKMVGATKELPSKTYEDFETFLDYAGKKIKKEEYQDGNFFKILSYVMEDTDVRSEVQEYITGTKPFQSDKKPLEAPAQKIVDNIASVVVDIDAKEEFLKTYKQNNLPLTLDLVLDRLPEEQVDVLNTAPEEKKEEIVKAVADELERDQQKNPFKGLEGYSELNLKPPEEKVFVQFLTKLQEAKIINEENLVQLSKIVGTGRGLSKIIKSFELPERKILIVVLQRVEVQKFIQDNMQQIEKTQEPGEEERSTTDPEKFDVDPELLNSLITASETFIDEFYEKAFLKDQGVLLKSVLTVLATIVEKEELEKAARRTPKPTEQPEETEETGALAEQEEQPSQDPVKLRNIQVDLKSFIKLVKRSKDVLKAFDEFRAKGKVVGSSYKEKFMNILKQLQKNIKALVRDISSLNLISEKKDVSETENKWSAIEKGYNEASRSLSNIVAAGAEDIESFDMEKNVNDAYTSLMSISGFFPSVNPFGAKTTKFNEYNELYTAAVKNVKSTIRDALELAKGQGGSNTANNTIESLKEFSGQIQSIFGIPSEFEDVQVKPNEPAAEGEPETEPTTEPSDDENPPEVEVEETFTEEIEEAMSEIKEILPMKKFTEHADKKYYNTFIKLILIMYSKDQLDEEIKIGSISAPLARAASTGMFNQGTLQEKLKSLLKNNSRLVSTISSMTRDINTPSMKILLGIIAANKSRIVSLDFDAILSKDFTDLPLNGDEKMLELGLEDDSIQEQLANKLKPLIKEMLTKGNKK